MYIFTILLLLAISAMLYLMVRALPRVAEEAGTKETFLDRWARSKLPEKIDIAINGMLVKLLRRVKVVALKFDNAVSVGLRKAAAEEREKERRAGFDLKDIKDAPDDREGPDGAAQ